MKPQRTQMLKKVESREKKIKSFYFLLFTCIFFSVFSVVRF